MAVRDFYAGQKGRDVTPRELERAKVRNGKVSFQAAINRRGASHLTTRADRMRERGEADTRLSYRAPASVISMRLADVHILGSPREEYQYSALTFQ